MTKEQIKGARFEVFVEQLLARNLFPSVRRNIEYHKSKYEFRQVDIEYKNPLRIINPLTILELKYSTNGKVNLNFRDVHEKEKKGQLIKKIDNIINELEERRRFVGAGHAVIGTNGRFEDKLHYLAEDLGIDVWEGDKISELYKRASPIKTFVFKKEMEEALDDFIIKNKDLRKIIEYM